MKKYLRYIVILCTAAVMLYGCKRADLSEFEIEYISDELPSTGQEYSEEDKEKIQDGITQWAKSYLLVDSNMSDEERSIADESLYESIVSDDEREAVREDREEFYENQRVKLGMVTTVVEDAFQVEYEGQALGRVTCTVNIKGTRTGERFDRTYDLSLTIHYGDVLTVEEIDSIRWE